MIRFGSARHDENGKIKGGKGGDQTGGEVAMQNYYMSSKGWYCFRLKDIEKSKLLAQAMTDACNNDHIGYNQSQRSQVVEQVKKGIKLKDIKTNVNSDCSSLVRACIIEATGKDPGNFHTATQVEFLTKTGLFEKHFKVKSSSELRNGDVLVTCTKGHTVAVVSGKPREILVSGQTYDRTFPKPTLKKGSKGTQVLYLQRFLNWYFGKKILVEDGEFGANTEKYTMKYQSAEKLEIDGIYGPKSSAKAKTIKR